MGERYPGYDVLAKRNSPSWNEQTRRVVDKRLAIDPEHHEFFSDAEWRTIKAICDRIVPQPAERPPIPVAAMLDQKLHDNGGDGYRDSRLPPMREAWRIGIRSLNADALARHKHKFHKLAPSEQDALLHDMQNGNVDAAHWNGMPPEIFFSKRVLHDITSLYYAHPTAWNEIGFGGPASPRGYVRMNFDRRDPWEAVEAKPGHEEEARRENAHVR
jgi:hypothetical protein